MSAVERAVEVMRSAPTLRTTFAYAEALADAGLLLTDADRAVLDAAKAHESAMRHYLPPGRLHDCNVCGAVRARREAQP